MSSKKDNKSKFGNLMKSGGRPPQGPSTDNQPASTQKARDSAGAGASGSAQTPEQGATASGGASPEDPPVHVERQKTSIYLSKRVLERWEAWIAFLGLENKYEFLERMGDHYCDLLADKYNDGEDPDPPRPPEPKELV
jgi:hypothetical protein